MWRTLARIDDQAFESLLEQVHDLHRRTDELTREHRVHAYVRAQLSWERDCPALPDAQRQLADEAVSALSQRGLSPAQSRLLHRAYFGR